VPEGRGSRRRVICEVLLSLALLIVAAVHLNLYAREGYKEIPMVGVLFLLTAISAVLLAVSQFVVRKWPVRVAAGLFSLSVLGGYTLTLWLPTGLFKFKEPGISYSGAIAILSEIAVAGLSVLTALSTRKLAAIDTPMPA
jgi:tellurite resistance protein TehA-like permease